MNKILNINLGGHAVTIDDDAYEYLKAYLENIRRRFKESDGRDEIMRDVEDRLGELVNQYKGNNAIVMLPHVESAIEVMGKPEDFGGEADDTATSAGGSSSSERTQSNTGSGGMTFGQQTKTGKRLYRDENDAVVSGVCSGLSAYFGINEPLWMRLIFVLLAIISAGFWVPVYILLMIIVPPARSATERLEMKGQPINVDSIAKEFQTGYERLSERVSNGGGSRFARGSANLAGGCVYAFGRVGLVLLILFAASMVLGLGSAWVAGVFGFFAAEPYINYFSPLSAGWNYTGIVSLFLVMGIPVVALCLWLANTVFRFKSPQWFKNTLAVTWILSFIALIGLFSAGAKSLRTGATISKSVDVSNLQSDTLKVSWADFQTERDAESDIRWEWPWSGGEVYVENEQLILREFIRIRVRKSNSDKFEVRQDVRARGANNNQATEHANMTGFTPTLSGNVLYVPHRFPVANNDKWWVRQITIYIGVPEGKYVTFDENIYNNAAAEYDEYAPSNGDNYISRSPNMLYRMTKDGLNCASCPMLGDANYRSERSYENFIFEGNYEIEIRRDDEFSMRIETPKEDVETFTAGDQITIKCKGSDAGKPAKIILTTNVLTSVYAENSGNVTIRGFDEGRATLSAQNDSKIKAYMDASDYLEVTLSDNGNIQLFGKGGELRVRMSDNATLDASDWRADQVEASATDNANGRVYSRNRSVIKTFNNADLRVEGTGEVERRD